MDEDKRLEELEKRVEKNEGILLQLVKDVMRFWHIGLGLAVGLIIEKFGLEKFIGKFL